MRKLLLTLLTGCLGILSQAQANYPCGDVCGAPGPCAPCYDNCCGNSFEGWYLGGNIGWAFHDRTWVDRDNWVDNFSDDWALGSVHTLRDAVTVGLQTGYNWQCGCALYGLEFDANWVNAQHSKTYSPSSNTDTTPTVLKLSDDVNWYGTLRGRVGIVASNLLLYFTAGAAWATAEHCWKVSDTLNTESFSDNNSRWGLATGFGAEWSLCGNWTLKAEALYLRFREHTKSGFSAAGNQTVHFDLIDSVWVGRVGFNYKFCGCGGWGWW